MTFASWLGTLDWGNVPTWVAVRVDGLGYFLEMPLPPRVITVITLRDENDRLWGATAFRANRTDERHYLGS